MLKCLFQIKGVAPHLACPLKGIIPKTHLTLTHKLSQGLVWPATRGSPPGRGRLSLPLAGEANEGKTVLDVCSLGGARLPCSHFPVYATTPPERKRLKGESLFPSIPTASRSHDRTSTSVFTSDVCDVISRAHTAALLGRNPSRQ